MEDKPKNENVNVTDHECTNCGEIYLAWASHPNELCLECWAVSKITEAED